MLTRARNIFSRKEPTFLAQDEEQQSTIVKLLNIEQIVPNPYQPRQVFSTDAIEQLASSISMYGLLQPICVRAVNNYYELISGERRLRACMSLGRTQIESHIIDVNDKDSALLALIENLQREDLHFLEEAQGYHNILLEHNLTQEELALRIGKSQSAIANKLRILRLPIDIKGRIFKEELSERHARSLLRLSKKEHMEKTLDIIIENGYTVRQSEELIETIVSTGKFPEKLPRGKNKRKFYSFSKDSRIYLNSIKSILKQMEVVGYNIELREDISESSLQLNITITSTAS